MDDIGAFVVKADEGVVGCVGIGFGFVDMPRFTKHKKVKWALEHRRQSPPKQQSAAGRNR